jgi:hypothetical protein
LDPPSTTTMTGGSAMPGPFGPGGTVSGFTAVTMDIEWDLLRVAFESNFAANEELGAQCVIFHRGRKVVDLAGSSKSFPRRVVPCLFSRLDWMGWLWSWWWGGWV